MPSLDAIRLSGEAKLDKLLAKLDKRHRKEVLNEIEQVGSVREIPDSFWERIRSEQETELVAALLVLILAGDEWTTNELRQQGVIARGASDKTTVDYALSAAHRAQDIAATTTDTLRNRLARKIEDAALTGPGRLGEVTRAGAEQAADEVFTPERRGTIATDATTGSLSTGQRGAAERIGGDGASTEAGQRVTIELIWRTEKDNRVCPRCSPLDGTNEEIWGKVFPNGPGPTAHPNCRCELEPRVIVEPADTPV